MPKKTLNEKELNITKQDMDILKDFVTIAFSGTLQHAAKMLSIDESGIISKIDEIERYFDRKLFVQEKRAISLTEEGYDLLLSYGPEALKILEVTRDVLKDIKKSEKKNIISMENILELKMDTLKDFVIIAFSGTTQRAAKILNRDMTNVRRKMIALEKVVGLKLFNSENGVITLTEEGYDFLLSYGPGILMMLRVTRDCLKNKQMDIAMK